MDCNSLEPFFCGREGRADRARASKRWPEEGGLGYALSTMGSEPLPDMMSFLRIQTGSVTSTASAWMIGQGLNVKYLQNVESSSSRFVVVARLPHVNAPTGSTKRQNNFQRA